MDAGLIVAIISSGIAIFTALFSLYQQVLILKLRQRQEERKLADRYKGPLMRSAGDLARRLHMILHPREQFLTLARLGTADERSFALLSTLFSLGEFFGWVEIIRQEVQFLRKENTKIDRGLAARILEIVDDFSLEGPAVFHVYLANQRAIGEVMCVPRGTEDAGSRCIGYSAFVEMYENKTHAAFQRWFRPLDGDFQALVNDLTADLRGAYPRLSIIQTRLVDLVNYLDPFPGECQMYLAQNRYRHPIIDKLPRDWSDEAFIRGAIPYTFPSVKNEPLHPKSLLRTWSEKSLKALAREECEC